MFKSVVTSRLEHSQPILFSALAPGSLSFQTGFSKIKATVFVDQRLLEYN
jgi:hypothetical protein